MTINKFNIEPIRRWPSGDCKSVMHVGLKSTSLSEKFGIKFLRDKDDLDWANFFYYTDEIIGPVILVEYDGMPGGGIEIQVDKDAPNEVAIQRIQETFEIRNKDIMWNVLSKKE